MKTRVIFPLCCICYLLLNSCERKIYCPAFPEHLIDYFPYHKGDTLSFVNQNKDTLSFLVSDIEKSEEVSESEPMCSKCGCGPPTYSVEAYSYDRLTHIIMYIWLGADPYILFNFNQRLGLDDWYLDLVTATSSTLVFYDKTGKDPLNPKNSALFGETVILDRYELPEYDDRLISMATIVKGKGITDFFDLKNNFQWKSINNKSH